MAEHSGGLHALLIECVCTTGYSSGTDNSVQANTLHKDRLSGLVVQVKEVLSTVLLFAL